MVKDVRTQLKLNNIPVKEFVFENCTSANRPSSPVDGQVCYETDTKNIIKYNLSKTRWEVVGLNGARTIKGVVGGSSQGALNNLPTTDVLVGDEYIVGADGSYGPSGSTQSATKGDSFVALTESSSSVAPTWLLVDNNSRISENITIASGTTSYQINNTIGSADLVVNVFDENGNNIVTDINVDSQYITIGISSNVATSEDGKVWKVVAVNG